MIVVTDSAKIRILELLSQEAFESVLNFRISVSSGGCSGFQYHFELDDKKHDDDQIFDHQDFSLIIDPSSLDLIDGCILDYIEDLAEARFSIKNPNASASCGCGNSFAI